MAEFIVKGVDAKNKTVEVFTPGQPSQSRTLSLESLQAHQVQDIEPGSHIQVLFKKPEKEQSTIKPVRVMKLPQP